jgi:hypothetical protein
MQAWRLLAWRMPLAFCATYIAAFITARNDRGSAESASGRGGIMRVRSASLIKIQKTFGETRNYIGGWALNSAASAWCCGHRIASGVWRRKCVGRLCRARRGRAGGAAWRKYLVAAGLARQGVCGMTCGSAWGVRRRGAQNLSGHLTGWAAII